MSEHEMKNAAYAELTAQGYLPTSKTDRMAVVDIVLDAIEPLIRADERERLAHAWRLNLKAEWAEARDEYRADLRAKVEAIPHAPGCPGEQGCWCPIHRVLDLMKEELS